MAVTTGNLLLGMERNLDPFDGMILFGVVASSGASILIWRATIGLHRPDSAWGQKGRDYLRWLDEELRFLRLPWDGRTLVFFQVLCLSAALACATRFGALGLIALLPLVAVKPWLATARKRRVRVIEAQVEAWLGALARALEASPSLGEALEASALAVSSPLRDEVTQTVAEIRLGRSLDRALRATGERIGSRTFSVALSAILVGRRTGGRLSDVLRTSAENLREIDRLQGVLRTKTAEGKSQATLIGAVPVPIYFLVRAVDPTYFVPLEETPMGHMLLALACVLWLAAILWAKKILAVDL